MKADRLRYRADGRMRGGDGGQRVRGSEMCNGEAGDACFRVPKEGRRGIREREGGSEGEQGRVVQADNLKEGTIAKVSDHEGDKEE